MTDDWYNYIPVLLALRELADCKDDCWHDGFEQF